MPDSFLKTEGGKNLSNFLTRFLILFFLHFFLVFLQISKNENACMFIILKAYIGWESLGLVEMGQTN